MGSFRVKGPNFFIKFTGDDEISGVGKIICLFDYIPKMISNELNVSQSLKPKSTQF